MPKVVGFKHLFDYCPKVEELVEQLRRDFNGDEQFLIDKRHLLEVSAHLEKRFTKLTPANKKKIGDAIAVLESLFLQKATATEIKCALMMAKALLKDKTPEVYPFLENFYTFINAVRNLLSEKRSASRYS